MEQENTASQSASPENTEVMQAAAEEESTSVLSADMYYKYEDLYSRPVITADSEIPENLLQLSHSFGYDSGRRMNLKLLDDRTLIFIAGNLLVLLDVSTREQKYLRSCSGGGIGSITTHPSKDYFVAAEKGTQPNIIVYKYPSLQPYRILRGGTERAYSFVDFNADGSLLASVGSTPDYLLTLWNWRQEEVMLSCKAVSQEVYRVSFSPYNPELLTSSGSGHIKFWKMTSTFTGLKLQGLMGHFGKTAATDIEAYVDLPDGKVVSGSEWGNLLLWDGNYIKVEICRKEGRSCHAGTIQPFALEHEQLMTFGSDGVVRGWDFRSIDTADSKSNSRRFELEPMNEMVVGHSVCLTSMVKSSLPDSFIWFAQDSSGAIWKLDLSFSLQASGPECLFSFHAGAIRGLDVSKNSHLMATTTLDRSVKVFDYISKKELTTSRFSQGGTALSWAPPLVDESGGLLATGFEDGVVRLLELYNPQKLHVSTGHRPKGNATLRLKQALKPHNAPVTALAFEPNGGILATGSSDCTVFFFTVGGKYEPIGFIHVPGPVQGLEWSPEWHSENRLLILCQSGHVVEVQSPDLKAEKPNKTFQLPELPRRFFRFRSIKSRIKRDEEIARRQTIKEEKEKECEDEAEESKQPDAHKEEEKDLPPIYIPDPPSPLYCGFYSLPGQFWLSLGGYDSGFLYHCKFSEEQGENTNKQEDEPFDFLSVHNTDNDPIRTVAFSSNRQLLLCGMHSGSIRVYLLQQEDHSLTSMQHCWSHSVHDNQYGHLQHICCSHDDHFVLTGGDDGNIFSFSLLPTEDLQKLQQTKVPSPRAGIENEVSTQDIVDPAAYSIELAKQKLEKDQLCREAELKIAERHGKLAELSKIYNNVLIENRSLPEHVCLKAEELQLHPCFRAYSEQLKSQRVMEVRQQFEWEQERCDIALRQLRDWFRDSLQNVVTVVAIRSNNRVSTYRVAAVTQASAQRSPTQPEANEVAAVERRKSIIGLAKNSTTIEEDELLHPDAPRPTGIKLGDRQIERLRKAAEKAEQARAKIEKRKQEWAQLYAEKPDENYEDPQALQAIQEARENIGDLKLKSAKDFTVPIHLRTNAERKRAELRGLEENMHELQTEMNRRVVALRDSKAGLVSWLKAQAQQLQKIQERLPAHLCREPPAVPFMLPEETPEKKTRCSRSVLECYRVLRGERVKTTQHEEVEGATSLLEQLEKEMGAQEWKEEEGHEEEKGSLSMASVTREEEEGVKLTELEEELQRENEIILLHEQDSLLEQMERSVWEFDAELMLLRHRKVHLDWQLKQADLCKIVLYQELLLLKEFERREDSLQEKLNECIREENSITSRLEDCNEQLELRHREIVELHEREKVLLASFQALLGKTTKFEDFLTKVFKKKVKRVKKKKQEANEEEEAGSDEDSNEDDDWDDDDDDHDDDYDSGTEEGGVPLNDSVCPPGCEPELFKKTLELRESRLDLEEQLLEEKKNAELVKKECDNLLKKEKSVKSSRQAVEEGLELVNKEKQQKMNELHIVVPLRLSQIEFVTNGSLPSDLSQALVVDRMELSRLQERIKQLQVEKGQQRELSFQARQQHTRLIHDRKEMIAKIQMLEKQCDKVMLQKFGRQVDLEALQTLSGNRRLEELKQEKLLREAAYAKEIRQCDAMVEDARSALMEVTKANTERLHSMNNLLDQKRELEHRLNARQRKMRQHFQDYGRHVDQEEIRRLHELVKSQSQLADAYRREIRLLSSKGGHMLPPGRAQLPPLAPVPPSRDRKTSKQGSAHPFKQLKPQN
ncbi:cilia- and flagella-associated protein 44 isoform X2 [Betta splendens]|uniref:Cilia- and flagella-associated protein 44 n=1 Tax=Betta splendens TaxID=158456 RepID=A0A9W2Y6M9_BETSP|nr:cilia- and flagella-associated protein 44 isoform X2 [Betta splendens]